MSDEWLQVLHKKPEVLLWPVIIITAVVILWLGERGSQNCTDGKCSQIAKEVDKEDTVYDIISKIEDGLEKHWTFVSWRLAALVAIFTGIVSMVVLWRGYPNGLLAFVVFAFIFVGVYLSFNGLCEISLKQRIKEQQTMLVNMLP